MNGKRIIVSAQKQWIQQQQKPEFCVLSKEGILVLFELFTTYVIVLFFWFDETTDDDEAADGAAAIADGLAGRL